MQNLNGEIFKNRRQDLNLTQNELALGITSQATICAIERGIVPNINILQPIMERLNLSYKEAFPNGFLPESRFDLIHSKLDKEHFRQVIEELNAIRQNSLCTSIDFQKYHYLYASAYFHYGRIDDANFHCDELFNVPDQQKIWFYYALANTIKAQIWHRSGDYYKAGICFDRVVDLLKAHPYHESSSMTSYIRMYQALAEHHLELSDLPRSEFYLKKAFKILKSNDSSWHFGELILIKARIAEGLKDYHLKSELLVTAKHLHDFCKSPKLKKMIEENRL